ncbi:unnamed protein product, partial [Iphiclides podalirius]
MADKGKIPRPSTSKPKTAPKPVKAKAQARPARVRSTSAPEHEHEPEVSKIPVTQRQAERVATTADESARLHARLITTTPLQPRPPKSAKPRTSPDDSDREEKIPRRGPTPAQPIDSAAAAPAAVLVHDEPPLSPDDEPQPGPSTSGTSMRQYSGAESSGAATDSTSYATLAPEVGERPCPAVPPPSYASMTSAPPSPSAAIPEPSTQLTQPTPTPKPMEEDAKGYPRIIVECFPDWTKHFAELKKQLGHAPNARSFGRVHCRKEEEGEEEKEGEKRGPAAGGG